MKAKTVKRRSLSQYRFSFFGLTQEYRINLFKQIHEIVFDGRGGYNYFDIYDMPIWLRNATFRFIEDSLTRENEAKKQAHSKSDPKSNKSVTNIQLDKPDRNALKSLK